MACPLRSRHFTQRPKDQVDRLNRCGADDAYHIEQGQSGRHVGAIQQALRTFRSRANSVKVLAPLLALNPPMPRVSDDEFDAGFYGETTRAAVAAYKRAFDIRRSGQAVADDIVGIMTIDSMDDHMLAIERGGPLIRRQDLVIVFSGAGESLHGQPDTSTARILHQIIAEAVQATPLYERHFINPPRVIAFFGAPRDSAKNPVPMVLTMVTALIGQVVRAHAMMGRIVVYGSSIGGHNALRLAAALNAAGQPIRYLGLGDAAFRTDDPKMMATTPDGRRYPVFTPPAAVRAMETLNTFQTRGNELESRIGTIPELHGGVVGLAPNDVSDVGAVKRAWDAWVAAGRPSDQKNSLFTNMHDRAVDLADTAFRAALSHIIRSMH